jgi:hypothetical protein
VHDIDADFQRHHGTVASRLIGALHLIIMGIVKAYSIPGGKEEAMHRPVHLEITGRELGPAKYVGVEPGGKFILDRPHGDLPNEHERKNGEDHSKNKPNDSSAHRPV